MNPNLVYLELQLSEQMECFICTISRTDFLINFNNIHKREDMSVSCDHFKHVTTNWLCTEERVQYCNVLPYHTLWFYFHFGLVLLHFQRRLCRNESRQFAHALYQFYFTFPYHNVQKCSENSGEPITQKEIWELVLSVRLNWSTKWWVSAVCTMHPFTKIFD